MTEDVLIELGREAIMVALEIAGPLLAVGLLVGLVVSVLQAVTQIQEATLSFIPKLLAVALAFLLLLPWMLHRMMEFTEFVLGDFRVFTG